MKAGIPFSLLLVDDDEDDRFFMDEAFKLVHYEAEVKKFITGADLLRYLTQIEDSLYPSLIVLNDNQLAQNAKEILLILKGSKNFQKIPVIIYTGIAVSSRREEVLAAGAFSYMEKGATLHEITSIAQQLKQLATSVADQAKNI